MLPTREKKIQRTDKYLNTCTVPMECTPKGQRSNACTRGSRPNGHFTPLFIIYYDTSQTRKHGIWVGVPKQMFSSRCRVYISIQEVLSYLGG